MLQEYQGKVASSTRRNDAVNGSIVLGGTVHALFSSRGDLHSKKMFCRRELKPAEDITPEERDARTAFCMQLARNIRPRDLEEFFSKVGQVSQKW